MDRNWKVVIKYRLGNKEDFVEYRVKATFSANAESIALVRCCLEFPKAVWMNVQNCRMDGVVLSF